MLMDFFLINIIGTNIKHKSEDKEFDFAVIMSIGVDCATGVVFIRVSKKTTEVVFLKILLTEHIFSSSKGRIRLH